MFRRIAGYFLGVANPSLGPCGRILSGAKALTASGIIALLLLLVYATILIPFTPSLADLRKAKVEQPSLLISADGKQLAAFKRINREWVGLERVSIHVIEALIATEDHRFYEHHGMDVKRTAAGIVYTLLGDPQGGSTLTQQLARNLYPKEIGRRRTITRKLKELITAMKIEYTYTKQEIMVTYLNTMPFLYNAYGIEMGARTYFDKPASKLTVLESATLIGMLKGTSYYNPVQNPERAVKRRNVVLSQMAKHKLLSQRDFDMLRNQPLRLQFERQPQQLGPAPHFAEHVRLWLIDWADRNDYNIYSDGLRVHATIDTRLQAQANLAVKRQMDALQTVADVEWGRDSERLVSSDPAAYASLRRRVEPFGYFWNSRRQLVDTFVRESGAYRNLIEAGTAPEAALSQLKSDKDFMSRLRAEKTRLEAGMVAIDPVTGHVRAWVGSRDFRTDQFDHVAQARRQPGSTFKPIVYGAALEQGMSPHKRFVDRAAEIPLPDGTVWRPGDVSPPTGQPMTARDGLIHSKNSISAQVMQEIGPKKTIALAQKMGIRQSSLDAVPALALGVSPVTPLEMVAAYSTIAARGEYREPVIITRITDKDGNVLATFAPDSKRALSSQSAEDLIDMMRGVVQRGTGRGIRSRFGIEADVAGKTGTTQNNTDGWFILMHPRLVAGSWVGFNDSRVAMRSNHWGQGGNNALLLVGDFFRQAIGSRMIDAKAAFPRPSESFFGSILDRIGELFGNNKDTPAPPPKPAPPAGEEEGNTPLDEVKNILGEIREMIDAFERQRRRVEQGIEEVLATIESVWRKLERLGGGGGEK